MKSQQTIQLRAITNRATSSVSWSRTVPGPSFGKRGQRRFRLGRRREKIPRFDPPRFGVAAAGHTKPARRHGRSKNKCPGFLHAMGDVHPHARKAELAAT